MSPGVAYVPNAPRGVRGHLFAGGVAWGLMTGTCTGATVGATMAIAGFVEGDGHGAVLVLLAGFGALWGLVVAIVPSLLGAAFVERLSYVVPAHATTAEWDAAVGRRLTAIHAAVNVLFLPLLVGWSRAVDASELLLVVSCVLLGNATIHAVLRRARHSLVAGLRLAV